MQKMASYSMIPRPLSLCREMWLIASMSILAIMLQVIESLYVHMFSGSRPLLVPGFMFPICWFTSKEVRERNETFCHDGHHQCTVQSRVQCNTNHFMAISTMGLPLNRTTLLGVQFLKCI